MRPLSRFLLGAVLACAFAGAASADASEPIETPDLSAYSAIDGLELDAAFEKSVAIDTDAFLARLGAPTSMDCSNTGARPGPETCVVTAPGRSSSIPAALAQH